MKQLLLLLGMSMLAMAGCSGNETATEAGTTLDEKIGQMVMVGFKGLEVSDTSHVIRDITEHHAGGVILFDYDVPTSTPVRNIESPEQVQTLIDDLQGLSESGLFIAVDQEGGRVARLKEARGFDSTVSAEYLGSIDNVDSTRHYASEMANQLQSLGFNVNFAPVVDVNTNPENPVIAQLERSFGPTPERVTKHARIFLEEFTAHNVLGVVKHFPGHGSAFNDSHVGMADVTETWDDLELDPYRQLIESDARFAVMTAHVFNENLDSEYPTTLSANVQTELLRNELGFEGVLFSDDMQMDAIRAEFGLETAVERAVLAGVDVLVFANNSVYQPDIVPTVTSIIREMVESGHISEERIDQSYERIMSAKSLLLN